MSVIGNAPTKLHVCNWKCTDFATMSVIGHAPTMLHVCNWKCTDFFTMTVIGNAPTMLHVCNLVQLCTLFTQCCGAGDLSGLRSRKPSFLEAASAPSFRQAKQKSLVLVLTNKHEFRGIYQD